MEGGNIIALPFSGNLWTRKRGPYFNEIRHLLKHQWALRILQKTNYYLYVVFLIVDIVLGRWTSCYWVISGAVSILDGGGTLPYNLYNWNVWYIYIRLLNCCEVGWEDGEKLHGVPDPAVTLSSYVTFSTVPHPSWASELYLFSPRAFTVVFSHSLGLILSLAPQIAKTPV